MNNIFYDVKPTTRFYSILILVSLLITLDIIIHSSLSRDTIIYSSLIIGFLFGIRTYVDFSAKYIDKLVFNRRFLNPPIEDKELYVEIIVENPTHYPFLRINMIDKYPGLFKLVKGSHQYNAILLPRSSISYSYVIKPVVGKHVFTGLEIIVSDPFKLFNYKITIDPRENTVYVKPKPLHIPISLIRSWASKGLGFGKTRIRGYGQEFYSLREYYPGDDYRFIDWKSYARTRKLYIKQFEREANLSIVFLIDASRNSMRSIIGETPFEYMARVVAGLSQYLVKRGDWIGLSIRSSKILRSGYGRGRTHYYKILNTIASVEWKPAKPIKTLGEIIIEEASNIPRRSKTLFFILTTLLSINEAKAIIEANNKLRSAGHIVYIVQFLPEFFELKLLKDIEAGIYYGLIYSEVIESRKIREYLVKNGIYVVTAGPRDILDVLYGLIERYRMVIV